VLGAQFIKIGKELYEIDFEVKKFLNSKWREIELEKMQQKGILQIQELDKDILMHIKEIENGMVAIGSNKDKGKIESLKKKIEILEKFVKGLDAEEVAIKKQVVQDISIDKVLDKKIKELKKELKRLSK